MTDLHQRGVTRWLGYYHSIHSKKKKSNETIQSPSFCLSAAECHCLHESEVHNEIQGLQGKTCYAAFLPGLIEKGSREKDRKNRRKGSRDVEEER